MKQKKVLPIILGMALASGSAFAQTSINKSMAPPVHPPANSSGLSVAENEPTGTGMLGVFLDDGYVELPGDKVKSDLHWGAEIKRVMPDSAAAEAGLKQGDLVLEMNGKEIRKAADLSREVGKLNAGEKVKLKLLRDEKEETVTAKLKERPDQGRGLALADPNAIQRGGQNMMQPGIQFGTMPAMPNMPDFDDVFEQLRAQMDAMQRTIPDPSQIQRGLGGNSSSSIQSYSMVASDSKLGVTLENLTPQLGEFFGAPEGVGALIATVEDDSAAKDAGLKAGDVITAIDGQSIQSPMDAQNAVMGASGSTLKIELIREKKSMTIDATLKGKDKTTTPAEALTL